VNIQVPSTFTKGFEAKTPSHEHLGPGVVFPVRDLQRDERGKATCAGDAGGFCVAKGGEIEYTILWQASLLRDSHHLGKSKMAVSYADAKTEVEGLVEGLDHE
jgi:hypothetical protein